MQKSAIFSIFLTLFLHINVAIAGSCVPMICDEAAHDVSEMLTEDGITGGPNNNNDGRFSSKHCYMCDTGGASECNYNDTVVIAGVTPYDHRVFQCTDTIGVDDTWVEVSETTICACGDSPLNKMTGYIANAGTYEIRDGNCQRGVKSNRISKNGRYTSVCGYRACLSGYEAQNGECVKKQAEQKTITPQKTVPVPTPNCKETRSTAEGKACCDLDASLATYNSATDKCVCKSGEFKIENGKGMCVVQLTENKCPEELISEMQALAADTSATQADRDMAIQTLIACGENVPDVEDTENLLIIGVGRVPLASQQSDKDAGGDPQPDSTAQSRSTIESAARGLGSILDGLEVSKWKNAEGKFNTARLASDSIAAVVLGTTGGVITSTVMKKHQVADGFENLKCSIGGQVVAEWGDEFRVGVQ